MNFSPRRISVEAPARLHLGFVDLNGNIGRKFGSLGLALEGLSTQVIAETTSGFHVVGDDSNRAQQYALKILQAYGLPRELSLSVKSAIPTHAGLGSGTQLALAIAKAISELFGLNRDIRDLAQMLGRGQRSGIGIGVFESGGFVFDGGHAAQTVVPPLLARFEFPRQWWAVLICDDKHQGLNGAAEITAFESIQPMEQVVAAELCRLTLLGVFPALVEGDFTSFSAHIASIQEAVGTHFGPCQGGQFTSPVVADVMRWIRERHKVIGIGQTSWGPTGFAFVEGEARALQIIEDLTSRFSDIAGLRFSAHRGCNHGAIITREERSTVGPMATA